jgi:acyl carrier protein
LTELFARVLGVPPKQLSDDSSPDSVSQWDSLKAMHLVSEIEETFEVELSTIEIMLMDSVGNARAVLKKKGAAGL